MNDQEAKDKFQEVRTKMLTNWKVLEDKEINADSTPCEIFQYVTKLDCELWMRIDLVDNLMHWSNQCNPLNEATGAERIQFTVDNCNEFFKTS